MSDWKDDDEWTDDGEPGHPGADPYGAPRQKLDAARNAPSPIETPGDNKGALLSAGGFGGTLPGQDPLKPLEEQPQSVKGGFAKRNEAQLAEMLSFMQGGSGNHVDELAGALGGEKARKNAEQLTDDATARYPGAHVAGALATSGPAAETAPARILVSGLLGANAAHGASKDGALLDSAGSGLANAGVSAGLEAVTHGASKLGPALTDVSRNQAIRSLNPLKSDVRMLGRNGIADSMADDLLSSGTIKFGQTAEGTAKNVAAELAARGKALGNVKSGIDQATGGATVLPDVAADSMEDIARRYLALPHPEAQRIGQDLTQRASMIRNYNGGKPMSLADAEALFKAPLDKFAEKVARTPGAPAENVEALAQARRAIKESNEKAAEAAATVLAPKQVGKFVPAKQAYGRMAAAGDILERTAPRELANRSLSPSDYGFGIAAGQAYQPPSFEELAADPVRAVGSGLTGFLAAQAHKLVRERGNTAAAVAAHLASKATAPVSEAARTLGPRLSQSGGSLASRYLHPEDDGAQEPEDKWKSLRGDLK